MKNIEPIYPFHRLLVRMSLSISCGLFSPCAGSDPGEALNDDNTHLALELRLPLASVERSVAFQNEFAKYQDKLIARFPGRISGTWVEPVPATRGHVRFTSDVPTGLRDELNSGGPLTQANVAFHANGLISMEDQAERAKLVALSLVENGHRSFSSAFSPISGSIRVRMQIPEGVVMPDKANLLSELQQRIQPRLNRAPQLVGRAKMLEATDVNFVLFRSSTPFFERQHSRGGAWLNRNGAHRCTSGWSVTGPEGDGIITAAHCQGLNQYHPPGAEPYPILFRDGFVGLDGDVEYHTTDHIELPQFYANAHVVRDTTSTRSTNTMIGMSVCVYGRASNVRTCNHTVTIVNETVVDPTGGEIGNLAETTNVSTQLGDSGGGVVVRHAGLWCSLRAGERSFLFYSGRSR